MTVTAPRSVSEVRPARVAPGVPPHPAAARRQPLWRELLGVRLRRLRHQRGETLGETADRAGVSPQYLSEMERGVKDPSSEMIAAVAGALGVTLVDLTLGVAEDLGAAVAGSPTAVGREASPVRSGQRGAVVMTAPFGLAA